MTALGLILSSNFCMMKHIDTVMATYARTLYGFRTLLARGMPQASPQLVFRATALAVLLYASPAWWGFANAGESNRLSQMSWQIQLLYHVFCMMCLTAVCLLMMSIKTLIVAY